MFFWQLCSDVLPTGTNFHKKHIPCSQYCHFCSLDYETAFHLFVSCDYDVNCWNTMGNVQLQGTDSFVGWINMNFNYLDEFTSCKLIMTCWNILKARNGKLWNQRIISSGSLTNSEKGT